MKFLLLGNVNNKDNCQYWSYIFREVHTQDIVKISWARILDDAIVDSMFLNENLAADVYLMNLGEAIDPLITEQLENHREEYGNDEIKEELIHVQQDCATSSLSKSCWSLA